MKKAFTLIELIFVIVIIGVLSAVAIPKFANLSDNAKISAEMATASSVQTAIDAVHSQWLTTRCEFEWGVNKIKSDDTTDGLNANGYPLRLGNKLQNVIKNATDWTCSNDGANNAQCRGPASSNTKGISHCKDNKPCNSKYWLYNSTDGTFTLTDK